MTTKSRAYKEISSLGLSSETTLPTEVAHNIVESGATSCGEGLVVSSCYGEGVTHATEKGSSSLKWKGSFVEGLDVVVCGDVSELGGCDIRPSKKLAVDEALSRVGVGLLHERDEPHMYVGGGLMCDKGVMVGSSAAHISIGRLPISDSSNEQANVLKRKALCVDEPLLHTEVKRRRDDALTVAHTVSGTSFLSIGDNDSRTPRNQPRNCAVVTTVHH